MLKYKWFTNKWENIPENIVELRKRFPGCHFRNGKKDGLYGIYILSDPDSGQNDYGEPTPSKMIKGATFWPPKSVDNKQELLNEKRKSTNSMKSLFNTESGIELGIIPATEEPRKVALSLFDEPEVASDFTTDYGKLAYDIDYKLVNDQPVTGLEALKLVVLAIERSYDIPLDLFNWLDVISEQDIEPLTYVCLGYELNEEDKKKEENT